MEHLYIPGNYQSELSLYDTQIAIKTVKDFFQQTLAEQLYLLRVSAPLFVRPESGLNDNLNGVERPVSFGIKEQNDRGTVGLGNVEGLNRHVEHILMVGGGERHNGMVAVGAPARLIHISLADMGGVASGGAAPLHIDNHAGDFRHDRITQSLLHQRKARAAGGGHHLVASE